MTDIGTLPGDTYSQAVGINAGEQVVGCSGNSQGNCVDAVLWENGSMVDLNTVTPPSNLHLKFAEAIADSGEILAYATLPNGDVRIAVLTPEGDCDSDCEERIAASESDPVVAAQGGQATRTMVSNAPVIRQSCRLATQSVWTAPSHAAASNARITNQVFALEKENHHD